jgi:capsular polysaccharide biosynthesis protein
VQEVRFVQDYLQFDPLFEGRNIVYQAPDTYVKVLQEVHFIKRSRFDRTELFEVLDLLKAQLPFSDGNRRVFLTRRGYRSLVNAPQIEAIAQELGFEIVDTSQLSLGDQMALFAATRHVVGIHGAGLTNMLFRHGRTMSVLELFPKNKVPAHYWQLAKGLGYNYTFLIGDESIENEQFHIDAEVFAQGLKRMLRDDPTTDL